MSSEIKRSETYRAIDLFAGIGGIRSGFEQAFENQMSTVFVSEWDKYAKETYTANFGPSPEIFGDITKVDERVVPPFDICLAGFPCQAFSLAGRRLGFNDDYKGYSRGTLFFDVVRICEYHKPKVIFAENVKGLVHHDKGRTFPVIIRALEQIGYSKIHTQILNSRNFGLAQNRERIYIVAFRDDIDDTSFRFPEGFDNSKRISDILEKLPVSVKYYLSATYLETLRRHRAYHEAAGNGFGYLVKSSDEVASALVCGGMGRERNLIIDYRTKNLTPVTNIKGPVNTEGIRKMTPREFARLQGYPDEYRIPVADVHAYKQFGNTVSVPVVRKIAENILSVLQSDKERE